MWKILSQHLFQHFFKDDAMSVVDFARVLNYWKDFLDLRALTAPEVVVASGASFLPHSIILSNNNSSMKKMIKRMRKKRSGNASFPTLFFNRELRGLADVPVFVFVLVVVRPSLSYMILGRLSMRDT